MKSSNPFDPAVVEDAEGRIHDLCMALPGTTMRPSHGAPTYWAGGKRTFVMYHVNHHGDGRLAVWCAAPPGVQATQVETEPERFFVPAYVGHRGWLGVRLDIEPDWDEVGAILTEGWKCVAGKRLIAQYEAETGTG